jgi:DNA-binding winged helix-turn-helix (wHTH) protein/TolB-like protein/Tfp pilus assembly protein PilF
MSIRYYEFGPFQIDKLNHALLRDGDTIPLKPKVFDTLLLLVENRERTLDKDEMLRRLWPDTVVEESNLSQNVYLLRKALCEETEGAKYIETMPKRGYRFVGTVTEVEAPSADVPTSPEFPIEKKRRRAIALVAGLILLLGIAVVVYTWTRSATTSAPRNIQIKSIAVLPFKTVASDNPDQTLGFAMADTLITRLSNIKQLQVRQTSSVRKFTSPNDDALAAGRELNVEAVLDASIHQTGNQTRITWRLIGVKDGAALSAGFVDVHSKDPFVLQDAVAASVTQELTPQLTGEEKNLVAKRYTENSEAYGLCVLGRFHLTTKVEDWKQALEYFNAAVEKDPDYALAYAGLANAYISMVADSVLPKAEAIPKAKEAAMKALQLDDSLAEAHVASARIMSYYDWDWAGAEREFKRAIELNTNSGDAHREYAAYLTNVGRSDEAIAEVKKARELDPLTLVTNFQMAWTLIGARRYDEALSESQQLIERFPNAHFWIGLAQLGKGMNEQAIKEFETTLSHSESHSMAKASLGYAYGATGKRDKARIILAEFEKLFRQNQTSPYYIAMIYAGLGDKDQTFAWLEESYREHSRPLASGINVNPMWDSIRSDPRFENLRRRMGLVQ